MSLNENPAVRKAYEDRVYTDAKGNEWRRGMDGWFLDNVDGKGGVMLSRHHDFVAMVEEEHPKPIENSPVPVQWRNTAMGDKP